MPWNPPSKLASLPCPAPRLLGKTTRRSRAKQGFLYHVLNQMRTIRQAVSAVFNLSRLHNLFILILASLTAKRSQVSQVLVKSSSYLLLLYGFNAAFASSRHNRTQGSQSFAYPLICLGMQGNEEVRMVRWKPVAPHKEAANGSDTREPVNLLAELVEDNLLFPIVLEVLKHFLLK